MHNIKATIQYDGTNYHGWQIQANGCSIQGELTRVISHLDDRHVTIHGAGRTDAGVHAEGQVASFLMQKPFSPERLRDAINGNLNRDIRVSEIELADKAFHARFSAVSKTYRYVIWTEPFVSPFIRHYVHSHYGYLDVAEMQRAASFLVGKHDFSTFTILRTDTTDPVRDLLALEIERFEKSIVITAAAKGFLRYMVRTMAGTLIDVGRGKRTAESVAEALEGKRRELASPTAPSAGLTLVRVDY